MVIFVVIMFFLQYNYCKDVYKRQMVARNKNADLLVSLHFNSGSGATGSEVWVSANKSLYKYNAATTELGNRILSNLHGLGLVNRGCLLYTSL